MTASASKQSHPKVEVETASRRRAPTLPKYMMVRKGTYYFKRRIPSDVSHAFPDYNEQVWKSLGTENFERAKLQLAVEVTEFDVTVSNARAQIASGAVRVPLKYPASADTTKFLLPAHIPAALARWEHQLTSTFDDLRRMLPATSRKELRDAFGVSVEQLRDSAAAEDHSVVEQVAQQLLSDERLIAPPGTVVREQMVRAMLPKVIETFERNHERFQGKVTPLPLKAPTAPRNLPTLLLLFEDWKKSQTRPRTINAVKKAVLEFQALHGALPVQAITRQHARDYRDHLVGLKLSDGTVANRLGFLATLVRHGHQELIEDLADQDNKFENIKVSGGHAEHRQSLQFGAGRLAARRRLGSHVPKLT